MLGPYRKAAEDSTTFTLVPSIGGLEQARSKCFETAAPSQLGASLSTPLIIETHVSGAQPQPESTLWAIAAMLDLDET